MFKKKKRKSNPIGRSNTQPYFQPLCPECLEEKKQITVFCLKDKDTYDIDFCPKCNKDPLIPLRLIEKPPYVKFSEKHMRIAMDFYAKGIVAEINKKSKIYQSMMDTMSKHMDSHMSLMKKIDSGVKKK